MKFCPWCGLMLQVEVAQKDQPLWLTCPVCPYYYVPEIKIAKQIPTVKNEVEELVFSVADAMKFAPKTKVTCPECHNGEAYFSQKQT